MTCRHKKSGFTLIELLIVMALCVLLATIAHSSMGHLHRLVARIELAKLHTICHYQKQRAMVTNTVQTITFHPHTNSYTYGTTHEHLPASLAFGTAPGTLGPPSNPKTVIANPITFTNNNIEFHPTGSIKAGAVYLLDHNTKQMYALSCPIAHVCYIRLYENSGSWRLIA
jgi:prepilin-type N-terminal cleavage/methylation domain-containing protein